jgi:hypothetical protein
MYAGGQAVSPGTYVSLEDGHFVRVISNSALPSGHILPLYHVRLADSAEHSVLAILLSDAAQFAG